MMDVRWLVVHQRDAEPWEVFPFEEEANARALYDDFTVSWTGVYLVQVVRDASRSLDEQPEHRSSPGVDDGRAIVAQSISYALWT